MICIFTCWTCSKKLDPEETTEEYFFWCSGGERSNRGLKNVMIKMIDTTIEKKLLSQNQRLQTQLQKMRKSKENLKFVQLLLKSMEHIKIEEVPQKKEKEN